MTTAWLIMSHQLPAQLTRLAGVLRAGSDGPVLVHHDPTGTRLDRPALDAIGGVTLVRPVGPVTWGTASELHASLALFEAGLAAGADRLVLLSGQDHPARPVAAIEADLRTSTWDGHVDGHPVPPPPARDEWTQRYYRRWTRTPALPGPAARLARRVPGALVRDVPGGLAVGTPRRRTPFDDGLVCRRGQAWLTLGRRAAERLVAAPAADPALLEHFAATFIPIEAYAHTVLHARGDLRLSGDSRRFLRFAPGARHPDVLTRADLPAVLASGADFARKFDERVDAGVLDELGAAVAS